MTFRTILARLLTLQPFATARWWSFPIVYWLTVAAIIAMSGHQPPVKPGILLAVVIAFGVSAIWHIALHVGGPALAAVAAVFCAGAIACGAEPVGAITTGGPVSPDGTRAVCDLVPGQHIRNTGGIGPRGPGTGAGLCVFTSVEVASRWQNAPQLAGLQRWMTTREGGGWPEKLDAVLFNFSRERGQSPPPYVQHTGGDDEVLELAVRTGRMPAVTYAGRDDFYGTSNRIAHMVNLAHLDANRAAIIDNNRPGKWVWMSRAEFLSRWRDMQGGWAFVLLGPPPPPYPAAPAVVYGDAGDVGPTVAPTDLPADGVVPTRVNAGRRYFLNGSEVDRTSALRAVTSGGLVDDTDRWNLSAVGDEEFRERFAAALAALPESDRGRFHVQTYPGDAAAVAQFRLSPGVTVRRPAKDRVGPTVGTLAPEALTPVALAALVDDALRPKPPAPTPVPAPAPGPVPGPAPSKPFPWGLATVAALVVVFLFRGCQCKN